MKAAFVDYRISEKEQSSLENLGLKIIKCGPAAELYDAINGHPDILLHILLGNDILVYRDAPETFLNELNKMNFNVIKSNSPLKAKYPHDVILNAITTPTHFIHNLNATDDVLLSRIGKRIKLNVKQGYTKCSTAVLSDNAFITSDKSICSALKSEGFDVLFLPPGDILLPGLDYGFIGGACGMIDENTMAFFGNLDFYPYKEEVLAFLSKHHVKPVYLYDGPLIDRGSLLTADIKTK